MDELVSFFNERLRGVERLAVLGAGSTLRADDAAGTRIVERLCQALGADVPKELLLCAGETAPENFSGKIRAFCPSHLVVVDAADLGMVPGSVVEIEPKDVGGPTFCSHMLPLRVMLDYLVQETGARVTLLGIQHGSVAFDGEMTEAVLGAVDGVCAALEGFARRRWL